MWSQSPEIDVPRWSQKSKAWHRLLTHLADPSFLKTGRWKTRSKSCQLHSELLDANLMQTTLSTLVTWSDSCKPCITYIKSLGYFICKPLFCRSPTYIVLYQWILSEQKPKPFCRDVETHAGAGSWETSGWLQPLPPWLRPSWSAGDSIIFLDIDGD